MLEKLKWFVIGFILVLIGAAGLLWLNRGFIQHRAVDAIIKKVQPSLPFKIKSYKLSRNLDFFELNINWNGTDATLGGPLHFEWLKSQALFSAAFEPLLEIEGASPLRLKLSAEAPTHLESVKLVSLDILETDFQWKRFGIETKKFSAHASLEKTTANLELHFGNIAWTNPEHSQHAVNLEQPNLKIQIPDIREPNERKVDLTAGNGEALWDSFYSDFSLSKLPLHLETAKEEGEIEAELKIGLKNELISAIKMNNGLVGATFKTDALPVKEFAPWAIKTLSSVVPIFKSFSSLVFKSGTLSLNGSLNHTASEPFSLSTIKIEGKKISVKAPESHLIFKNVSFSVPYKSKASFHEATIEADQIAYRHLIGSLKKTRLRWNEDKFEIKDGIPLTLQNLPITIGPVFANLKPSLELHTSLKLNSSPVTALTNAFCVAENKIPPATFDFNFTDLKFSPGVFDPTGKVKVELFKGKAELNDIGFYDLNTDVPEIDFDVEWSGIDLQSLGNWSNFGEIKGTLDGYAHNVVLQSFLPTHYFFKVETSPLDKGRSNAHVEFSPEAMKNVVKVFTGNNLDEQVPGIAGWMMFGWPSHFFGGYDVYYAGIKVSSEDGIIEVESLDLPDILQKEQKHFVIYGPRFKMPLRTTSYPILLDATSMSNFIHQLIVQLGAIKKQKEEPSENVEPEIVCEPPEL